MSDDFGSLEEWDGTFEWFKPAAAPRRERFQFTDEQTVELARLASAASQARARSTRYTPAGDAAEKLEMLLLIYKGEGASLQQMADAAGVSRSSIAQRLRKYRP